MRTTAVVVAGTALALSGNTRAFKCVTQLSTDEADWADSEENCETFCLIAHGKTTLLPSFIQPLPVCLGVGCAKLDQGGNLILEGIRTGDKIEGSNLPFNGPTALFKCDNVTITKNLVSIEQDDVTGPCNLYTDVRSADQICKQLPSSLKVDSPTFEASFVEVFKYQLLMGGGIFLAMAFFIFLFVWWRKRAPQTGFATAEAPGIKLSPRQTEPLFQAQNQGQAQAIDIFDAFDDFDDFELAASGVGDLDALETIQASGANIPTKYAPGSSVYERFHMILTEVYKDKGGNSKKIEAVLHSYLSQPDGAKTLNKKLNMKFKAQVDKVNKAINHQDTPFQPSDHISDLI